MNSFQPDTGFPFASAHYSKAWSFFRLVPIGLETLLETHQKNLVAVANANRVAFDGLTTLIQRQNSLLNATAGECSRGVNDALAAVSLEEKARRQAEAARLAYELTLVRFGELYEIATKAHMTAADILNARLAEALDEFKALFAAPTEPSPAPAEEPGVVLAQPVAIVAAPAELVPAPAAEPGPVHIEAIATIAEPVATIEQGAEEEDPDDPISPKPTKASPRGAPTTGASGARSARRPRSRG